MSNQQNTTSQLPISETQWVLKTLAEECNEVAHRVCKSERFGFNEVQEGQSQDNKQRLTIECCQTLAMFLLSHQMGLIDLTNPDPIMIEKLKKIEKYLKKAIEQGIVVENGTTAEAIKEVLNCFDNSSKNKIWEEILTEREIQDEKWGGAAHDDTMSIPDFAEVISDYSTWAKRMSLQNSTDKARKRLIQIAALAVAAVESIDRKEERECPF